MNKATVIGSVAGGLTLVLGGCGSSTTATLPNEGVRTIASGTFERTGSAFVAGEARVAESFGDLYLEFGEGFNAATEERMRVGFGRDGVFDPSTRFTTVKSTSGRQTYFVPESINPYEYNEVYLWGNTSRDILGFATLTRAPETFANVHSTGTDENQAHETSETFEADEQASAESDTEG